MPFMAVLMIVFIVVMALATFIESAYSTQTAWALVYGALYLFLILLPVFVLQDRDLIDRTVRAYLSVPAGLLGAQLEPRLRLTSVSLIGVPPLIGIFFMA